MSRMSTASNPEDDDAIDVLRRMDADRRRRTGPAKRPRPDEDGDDGDVAPLPPAPFASAQPHADPLGARPKPKAAKVVKF